MVTSEQRSEIDAARAGVTATRRPTVEALEQILYEPLPVLDHGFLRVVDYMGSDDAIVQAARVSYGRGTKRIREDRGLIRYLMRNRHTSPFEMCEIKFHVRLPVFVARQWIRHRTASVNEQSARYSILENEFYVPSPDSVNEQSTTNRQGRGGRLDVISAQSVADIIAGHSAQTYELYERLLGNRAEGEDSPSIARELARIVLPVNVYTQWYWKIDLHNLLHFLRLRTDPHAQLEIRVYAEAMLDVVRKWVPLAAEAFDDFHRTAVTVPGSLVPTVRKLVSEAHGEGRLQGLPDADRLALLEELDLNPS